MSRIICKILRVIVENRQIFIPHLYLTPPMVLSVFDDWYSVHSSKTVKNSQKSQNSKNHHWCTNRHMSTHSLISNIWEFREDV